MNRANIKVACIGAGYFARFHVEAWKRIPEVELVAICDSDLSKARQLAATYQVNHCYSSFESLCAAQEVDVVDIITPPNTHLDLCKQVADQGNHIICQKPLAPTLKEAQQICEICAQAGVRFMVHENFRFQPWYRKIKELLDAQTVGDVLHSIHHQFRMGDGWGKDAYLDRQPYFQTMPRLLIYETGIHFVDVFRFLAGEIHSVYARLRKLNPVIAGEDSALVLLEFAGGGQGVLDGNRYNEPNYPDPRYTFGTMSIEGNGGSIRLLSDGKIFVQPLGKEETEIPYHHENKNFGSDCVYATQRHFVEALLKNEPFENGGAAYLQNILVQEAIYQSHQSRAEVIIGA